MGTKVRVVGYDDNMLKERQKLIGLGLNTHCELTLFEITSDKEKPITVKVGCFYLSLSIEEADALIIKIVKPS